MESSFFDKDIKTAFSDRVWALRDACPVDLTSLRYGKVVGLGANIMNGYGQQSLCGNMTFLCSIKELDGLDSGLWRFVYIKDYKDNGIGFYNNGVTTPERTICDFIMYPDELSAGLWVWDALEGYEDEYNGDWSKVYEMMDILGISRKKLDSLLDDLLEMSAQPLCRDVSEYEIMSKDFGNLSQYIEKGDCIDKLLSSEW